jgi:hypothetical protein
MKTATRDVVDGPAKLLEAMTRQWGQSAMKRLPPEFVGHMRAAMRELFLAGAALCDSALKTAEEKTAQARRRVQRIPVTTAPRASRRRAAARPRG